MLGTLLLVFREVLEAALIVSIVAAATRGVVGRGLWISAGIALGLVGAAVVAGFAGAIGNSMDGMGQEWFNAGVLLAAVLMISWHVVWMARHSRELSMHMKAVGTRGVGRQSADDGAAGGDRDWRSCAKVRKWCCSATAWSPAALRSAPWPRAACSDCCLAWRVGFALYFGLLKIPVRHFFSATNALLVLLAAGLASSAAGKLVQADVLPTLVDPLWDSSWLLTDESVVGNMLHVLVGYTAQPSGIQMVFYAATVVLLLIGMRLSRSAAPAPRARAAGTRLISAVAPSLELSMRRFLLPLLLALAVVPVHAADKEYTLTLRKNRFVPAQITVPANTKVKLVIVNEDATPEEFESHELNREKIVTGKGKIIVWVGPLKPGKYPFFGEFHMDTAQGVLIAK